MKLVLTNDDGIDAPGIQALADAVAELGQVLVLAPQHGHSGCGHQATVDRPLNLQTRDNQQMSVDGTPVDCVRLALLHIQAEADWVIAGVNDGANLGVDTHMSGTVAAAREAALLGKKAISLSHYRRPDRAIDWERATRWTAEVLRELLSRPLAAGEHWNVNLPAECSQAAAPPMIDCPLDPHPLPVEYEEQDGAFMYRTPYHLRRRASGADVDVCFGGSVSVTRLSALPGC